MLKNAICKKQSSELIEISKHEGKQVVSARTLYIGLGLSKSQWSRWYKQNILENEFFKEKEDFIKVRHNVEGNEVVDFAISIDFAKHIAMMAKTERSHEYRNYFISCEKKLKEQHRPLSFEEIMIAQLQEQQKMKKQLEMVSNNTRIAVGKVEEVEYKLDKQMTINATQQKHIQDAVKKKVYERLQCCKDFDLSFDTAEHKAQFFSSLYGDLKKRFGVPTYRDILFVDYEAALTYVKAWIEPADIRG